MYHSPTNPPQKTRGIRWWRSIPDIFHWGWDRFQTHQQMVSDFQSYLGIHFRIENVCSILMIVVFYLYLFFFLCSCFTFSSLYLFPRKGWSTVSYALSVIISVLNWVIVERQPRFAGHVLRQGKLKHLVTAEKPEGQRGRWRQTKKKTGREHGPTRTS